MNSIASNVDSCTNEILDLVWFINRLCIMLLKVEYHGLRKYLKLQPGFSYGSFIEEGEPLCDLVELVVESGIVGAYTRDIKCKQ